MELNGDPGDLQLVNQLEHVVRDVVDGRLAREPGLCSCSRCRLDTIALALNSLPPRYVVTNVGEVMTRVALCLNQWQADVLMAVMRAEETVRGKPRHPPVPRGK